MSNPNDNAAVQALKDRFKDARSEYDKADRNVKYHLAQMNAIKVRRDKARLEMFELAKAARALGAKDGWAR